MRKKIVNKLYSLSVRKKIILFYLICVIFPLFVVDGLIASITYNAEKKEKMTAYENLAVAVDYALSGNFATIDEMVESVYLNRGIYNFLNTEYSSGLQYYMAYQELKKTSTLWGFATLENCSFTFYTDNPTIVGGGGIQPLDKQIDSVWYRAFLESGKNKLLWFGYYNDNIYSHDSRKHIYMIRNLDYYPSSNINKILVFEYDYEYLISELSALTGMQETIKFEVVSDGRVVLSNDIADNEVSVFKKCADESMVAYSRPVDLYGCEMSINILDGEDTFFRSIQKYNYVLIVLIAVSMILPLIGIIVFKTIFTNRLLKLSNVVLNSTQEHLDLVPDVEGEDEIATLSQRYNNMALRINNLIDTVYKQQIRETESTVARQKAELLALQSQINPHFLFNALESIRMHSIIKHEDETARMIENLAVIQRQYVEWNSDVVAVSDEMNFVHSYLELQSYRFGDRLSYNIEVEKEAENLKIPKLSIVTFVENACIHGIEPKSTKGWVFVRVYVKDSELYVEVEDTGKGMDEEEAQALCDNMNNADIEMLKNRSRVGIINACIRLKMYTDSKVVFDVSSEQGIGTIITTRMTI